jgi:YVTN family beta-propeller protein
MPGTIRQHIPNGPWNYPRAWVRASSCALISATGATGRVTSTISLAGDPDTLALTPDGSQLWVGGLTSAIVTVLDTANDSVVGEVNLGNEGANSGDGYEPTGIVLTTTPTPSAS